jgi:ribonuclease HIII
MSGAPELERFERAILRLEQPGAAESSWYGDSLGDVLGVVSDDDLLQGIGEPILLNRTQRILSQAGAGTRFRDYLEAVERQYARMVDVHQKLAAALDRSISIDDLLYEYLDRWQILDDSVGRRFSDDEEAELELIRWNPTKPSLRLQRFFERYAEILGSDEGYAQRRQVLVAAIDTARHAYEAREAKATVYALFADPSARAGVCRPVSLEVAQGAGGVYCDNDIDRSMKQAVERAVTCGCRLAGFPREQDWEVRWTIHEPHVYEGESIGLATAVAVASRLRDVPTDCYTAFTGTLAFDGGRVERVEYVREKLTAARTAGFRRVFVPRANLDEVEDLVSDTFVVHGVETVEEAWRFLQPSAANHSHQGGSLDARVRRFELECLYRGWKVKHGQGPGAVRLYVTDHRAEHSVDFFQSKQGITWNLGGSRSTDLWGVLQQILDMHFTRRQPGSSVNSLFVKYAVRQPDDRVAVQAALRTMTGYEGKDEKGCDYRAEFSADGERVIVWQYSNGTLTVQQARAGTQGNPIYANVCQRIEVALQMPPTAIGDRPAPIAEGSSPPFVQAPSLDPMVRPASRMRSFEAPWIGIDESGKGDYFGPLVSAAVYVDDSVLSRLEAIGIRDSKQLSDARNRQLAAEIRQICGPRTAVVEIHPERYNELYAEIRRERKSLTQLLAWSHARALEDLLGRYSCDNVLADQFADVEYLRGRLLEKGRAIANYVAMPRAESDIAVAAASILARDRFLHWLESNSRKYSVPLFKGASPQVVESAKQIVRRFGQDELAKVAKLHFKTTEQVTGSG